MKAADALRKEISPLSRDVRVRLAAYAGVLAAYASAVKEDPLTPFQVGFFLAAAAWSLCLEHRFRKPFFSPPIKIGLIVLGSAIFVAFVSGASQGPPEQFANSIARFLFWNAIVFVLSRNKSEYDLWTLAIIELSLFMISGAFVQPAAFLPLLLGSTACFLYAFHRVALLRCGTAGEEERGGAGLVLATFTLALEAAVVVFLAFPRGVFRGEKAAEASLASVKDGPVPGEAVAAPGGRTGIPRHPEFLDLSHLDRLKIDPRPVLRIRTSDADDNPLPPEQTLYLRGAVLDTYEGGRWRADFQRLDRKDADDDGWTDLHPAPPGRVLARQHIRTTALAGDLTFCLPDPVRVHWRAARYDPSGILFFAEPPAHEVEYDVESSLMPLDIPSAQGVEDAPERYLQIPPGLEDLRMLARDLGRSSTRGRHSRVTRMVHYLMRNGYAYKLAPFVPTPGRDPVEHFLFDKKEGYCSHFATALALLCRSAGVPARVATGFQLHDPKPDGSFLVKNSDAHAWVEVWFGKEHGWRAYDATPDPGPGAGLPPAGEPVATRDQPRPDGVSQRPPRRWDDFILNFGPGLQSETLGRALHAVGRAASAAGRWIFSPVAGLVLAFLAAAALLSYLCLPRGQRRRLRQIVGGFRERSTVDFYRDFLWALSRQGVRKHPALTAREFACEARRRIDDEGIDFVTERFYEAKYRGVTPAPEDRRRIDAVIARLLADAATPD
jgi:hypothetical protein